MACFLADFCSPKIGFTIKENEADRICAESWYYRRYNTWSETAYELIEHHLALTRPKRFRLLERVI